MKLNIFQKETLKKAIAKFGKEKQRLIAIEELSELQKAVIKDIRVPCRENRINIAEETADVYIMLKQIEIMYEIEPEIQKIIDFKVRRLKELIGNK